MSATELLLIDLSAIAHMIWHTDTNNPDPSRVSAQTITRVRALASEHRHAAICCDSGKSFRADIDPAYKANRDTENRAPLRHQMQLACETLAKDGFPVWAAAGFEADDIIATATAEALRMDPDVSVLIASADKDLLQLVSERVRMKKITDGSIVGPVEVQQKFKVTPAQMHDYLCLVGDTSDNIVGAKGIGGVTAAKLLNAHGSIAAIYEAMKHGVVKELTPSLRSSMVEFEDRWPVVARLIDLKSDVPIEFSEIATERTATAMTTEDDMSEDETEGAAESPLVSGMVDMMERQIQRRMDEAGVVDPNGLRARELNQNDSLAALGEATARVAERIKDSDGQKIAPSLGATRKPADPTALAPYAPVDFSQQLEPRNMTEAVQLAQRMYESRLFGAYGTPQAVLATVMAGRELGIPAMASLRAFHVIEGKPTMSAGTIQSLVIKSGKAKYFRCTERTNELATFETQRGDDPPVSLSFSVEDGRRAWPKDDVAFAKSGWGRNPADMCVARASSKLARLVYPDVVSGLYAPEEMD